MFMPGGWFCPALGAVGSAVGIASGVSSIFGGDSSSNVGNVAGGSIYDPYAAYRGQAAQTLQALLYGGTVGGSSGFTPLNYTDWAAQQNGGLSNSAMNYLANNWHASMGDIALHGAVNPFRSRADTSYDAYQKYLDSNPARAGSAGMSPTDLIKSMPGFQFGMEQGIGALDRTFAAKGSGISGNEAIALQDFGNQYAGNYYQNMVQTLTQLSGATMGMSNVTGQNQLNNQNQNAGWSALQQGISGINNSLSGYSYSYNNPSNNYQPVGIGYQW